jgi:hypothetical protein
LTLDDSWQTFARDSYESLDIAVPREVSAKTMLDQDLVQEVDVPESQVFGIAAKLRGDLPDIAQRTEVGSVPSPGPAIDNRLAALSTSIRIARLHRRDLGCQ